MGQTEVPICLEKVIRAFSFQDSRYLMLFLHRKWVSVAKSFCSAKDAKEFCLYTLKDEISMLEKELPNDHQEIGFCHNDLQYGNIMIDEETSSITIIVSFTFLQNMLNFKRACTKILLILTFSGNSPVVCTRWLRILCLQL